MLVPSAVMIVLISSLPSILSRRAFSTFRILPFSGKIAWNLRSRPCLAEPPALSPSTRYSSHSAGSRLEQSASLPGSEAESSADLRLVRSRALRAASRPCAAVRHLPTIALASLGCSSRYCPRYWLTSASTRPLTSVLPSLALVWPSNCGSGIFTEMIAVRPSRTSSPVSALMSFFSSPAVVA